MKIYFIVSFIILGIWVVSSVRKAITIPYHTPPPPPVFFANPAEFDHLRQKGVNTHSLVLLFVIII